jgi:UDP-N-acetylglucosamine 2-epimerase (non-hydrolysing)
MNKLLFVFGTRPEAIKLCRLVIALKAYHREFHTVTCVTAQHREMLDQVLRSFDVEPDYDLNLMKKNQTLFDITTNILNKLDGIIRKEKIDIVIVQGDTTTTFAAALAAYYNRVSVGHVEAGLRTGDKYSPFPEEMNRKLTTSLSDIHFAPTESNRKNLLAEGIPEERIIVTGNTVIDALLWVRDKIRIEQKKFAELAKINFSKRVILITGHRRENFGQGFVNLCNALKDIAVRNADVEIVYPVHLNPNVRQPVNAILSGIGNIKLLEPLDYEPFVHLMDRSYFIITDSGGVQEEAPSLGKPVLVTRSTTERPEALDSGAVKLVGTDRQRIINESQQLLSDKDVYRRMSIVQNPYGDGHACERIIKALQGYFSLHN